MRTEGMYGYELWKRFASEGDKVQLSYLYKTLAEMSKEGLLVSRVQRGDRGPSRRQYFLSALGRRELGTIFAEATELVHDFYEDYMAKLPPEFFSERFNRMCNEVWTGRESLAMVISQPLTRFHQEILENACRRTGAKHTYLVKPPESGAAPGLPGLTVLDGSFEDIQLKEKSLDCLIVVDIQDATNLKRCLREFRRLLRSGGVMFGCAPFMGLAGPSDPLDVGEFMKKMKYGWSGKPYLGKDTIKKGLEETFDYVFIGGVGFVTGFISGLKPI